MERRHDDERINQIKEIVVKMDVLVSQVHQAMFGNGKPGVKAEMERFKGQLSVWRWIAGGSGLVGICLLILEIIKYVR